MRLDNVKTDIIIEIANRRKIPASQISEMLKAYYKSASDLMENNTTKATIKLDFLGKLIYSDALENKNAIIAQKIKEKEDAANGL